MLPDLQSLGIDKLSVDEKLVLIGAIWDSIADEPHPSFLSDEQRRELERRLDDADRNPDDAISWDDVRNEALKRLDDETDDGSPPGMNPAAWQRRV
jgi:putative addiction module component (TIGR02574 family)